MTHRNRDDVLEVPIKVLFSNNQIPALEYMAARAGKPVSTFIRDLVLVQVEASLNPPVQSKYVH